MGHPMARAQSLSIAIYHQGFSLRKAHENLACHVMIFLLAWKTGEKHKRKIIFYKMDNIVCVIVNFIQINCKLNYSDLALINKYPPTLFIHSFV
jgi:hypothetical protein